MEKKDKMTMNRNAVLIDKDVIKPGDRVEFRQYGFNQQYATGRVLKVDAKGITVSVDKAMRRARVVWDDLTMVMR